jgi:archaellin
MAQELKEHFPEAVTVSTGYLPIDLSSVKVTYSDPSKTIIRVANLASYEINDNTKLSITNPSGDTHLVTITDFDNNTNSITLDKNIPDNFVRLRFFVDDFHYVQYDKFIPITISAIKKLKSTQDELVDSIKKLKSTQNDLIDIVKKLKN